MPLGSISSHDNWVFLVSLEFFMFLMGLRHYYSYDLSEIKDEV